MAQVDVIADFFEEAGINHLLIASLCFFELDELVFSFYAVNIRADTNSAFLRELSENCLVEIVKAESEIFLKDAPLEDIGEDVFLTNFRSLKGEKDL